MRKIAVITSEDISLAPRSSKVTTFEWDKISSDGINLRDYDGIVIDVAQLPRGTATYDAEQEINPNIICDVLASKGSFVVVVGDPATVIRNESIAERIGIRLSHIRGAGDLMKMPDLVKGTHYEAYIRQIKQYDFSYKQEIGVTPDLKKVVVDQYLTEVAAIAKPLLYTKAKYNIASEITVMSYNQDSYGQVMNSSEAFKGDLVFVPALDADVKESVESVLDIFDVRVDGDTPPIWVEEIEVVGQSDIDANIGKDEAKLAELTENIDRLTVERSELRKGIEILYKSEKSLEKALKDYLKKVGFVVVEPNGSANKVEFYLEVDELKFVVEVKSTVKQMFDQKGLRQANDWRDDILLSTGEKLKPLFIGSNQYKIAPHERSEEYLAQNLIDYAKSREIACITVNQLFAMLQRVEASEQSVRQVADLLFKTQGIVTLSAKIPAAVSDTLVRQ